MPVITCPTCASKYDLGIDKRLEAIDPSLMALKVMCPACGQWLRLSENEPVPKPNVPSEILEAMMGQSQLIERGAKTSPAKAKRPWWKFW